MGRGEEYVEERIEEDWGDGGREENKKYRISGKRLIQEEGREDGIEIGEWMEEQ